MLSPEKQTNILSLHFGKNLSCRQIAKQLEIDRKTVATIIKRRKVALDSDNNVIFLHLGRGTPKTLGTYWKANRLTIGGWINLVESNILA